MLTMTDEEMIAAGPPPRLDGEALEQLLCPPPLAWWKDWRWIAAMTSLLAVAALAVAVVGLVQANDSKAAKIERQTADIEALRLENECRSRLAVQESAAEDVRDDLLVELDATLAGTVADLISGRGSGDREALAEEAAALETLRTSIRETQPGIDAARAARLAGVDACHD